MKTCIETSVLIKLLHMSLDGYTQHVTETEVRDILIFCYIIFSTPRYSLLLLNYFCMERN